MWLKKLSRRQSAFSSSRMGGFTNVEQRWFGDAGTEQRGCQRAAAPSVGLMSSPLPSERARPGTWVPEPPLGTHEPARSSGCAGTVSPRPSFPQEPSTSAGPAGTAQSHPGAAVRFRADRIRGTNPLPVAKSAQSSGLASSVSSCKRMQGHSQEGEALKLRLVLAPGPAVMCSAMADPGTVSRQLGSEALPGQRLATAPGSAGGCQGRVSGDSHHIHHSSGTLVGDAPSRTPAASAALCAGIAALSCGEQRGPGAGCAHIPPQEKWGLQGCAVGTPGVQLVPMASAHRALGAPLCGRETCWATKGNWLCKKYLLCRVGAVLSSLRAIKRL